MQREEYNRPWHFIAGRIAPLFLLPGCHEPSSNTEISTIEPENQFRAIYDDRDILEFDEADSEMHRRLSDSVCAIVREEMTCGDEECQLPSHFIYEIRSSFMGAFYQGCRTDPFRGQSAAATCSGFLIAPDIVMTAGHCMSQENGVLKCDNRPYVFKYRNPAAGQPKFPLRVAKSNMYKCKSVTGIFEKKGRADNPDWALVKLDRPVSGIQPISSMRLKGPPPSKGLFTIGHPWGLTQKISKNGNIKDDDTDSPIFYTDLDSSNGSSGSPVFGPEGTVEGIFVIGTKQDVQVVQERDAEYLCGELLPCNDKGYYRPICIDHNGVSYIRAWAGIHRISHIRKGLRCFNQQLDPSESDIDCGRYCKKCKTGNRCKTGLDCESLSCLSGMCVDANCFDGIQNGRETQIDYGPECTSRSYTWEDFVDDHRWRGEAAEFPGEHAWQTTPGAQSYQFLLSGEGRLEHSSKNAPSIKTVKAFPPSSQNPLRMIIDWSYTNMVIGNAIVDAGIRVALSPMSGCDTSEVQALELRSPGTHGHGSFQSVIDLVDLKGPWGCVAEIRFSGRSSLSSEGLSLALGSISVEKIAFEEIE